MGEGCSYCTLRTASAYGADMPLRLAIFAAVSPLVVVALISAPATMRATAASLWPENAAYMSAVMLAHN